MTNPNSFILHQVLLHHASGIRSNIDNLTETLLGRGGNPATLTGVLEYLVSEGALSRTEIGPDLKIARGPRFEEVDATLSQADTTLDACQVLNGGQGAFDKIGHCLIVVPQVLSRQTGHGRAPGL